MSHQRRRIGLRVGTTGRGAAFARTGGGGGGTGLGAGAGWITGAGGTGGVGGIGGTGGVGDTGGTAGITTGGAGTALTGPCAVPHHGQKSTGWGNARPQPVLMQESSCAMVPRISLLP